MIVSCQSDNCCNFFSITTKRQQFKRFCNRNCKSRNCDKTSSVRAETSRVNARNRRNTDTTIKEKENLYKSIRYHKLNSDEKKAFNKERNDKYKSYRLNRHYERMTSDTHYMLRQRISDRIRKALKDQRSEKSTSCLKYIGCSIPELRSHLEKQFKQGMSWKNYPKWHIDHIKPCAVFDLTCEEQQKECFNYTNLQPLWADENLAKSDKWR